MIVSVSDFLAGFFGGGVEASGLVGAVRFGERDLLVEPVDGTGRGPNDGGLRVGRFAGFEKRDEARDVAVDVGLGILHGVAHAGLCGKVHDVSEGHDVEELGEKLGVVDVAFDDEDLVRVEKRFTGFLEGGIVVVVEVVESNNAISASFQGEGDVGADETGCARYEYRHASLAVDLGGCADLLLPLDPAPGGGEVAAAGIDETLEAEIGGGEGDEKESPEKHGTGRGETAVELAVHGMGTLDLEFAWS